MAQLRVIGVGLAVVGGLSGGLYGLTRVGRKNRLTAADIHAMDDASFSQHIRSIGLEAQVSAALARLPDGPAR